MSAVKWDALQTHIIIHLIGENERAIEFNWNPSENNAIYMSNIQNKRRKENRLAVAHRTKQNKLNPSTFVQFSADPSSFFSNSLLLSSRTKREGETNAKWKIMRRG